MSAAPPRPRRTAPRPSPYQWIIDRARAGEPVPIETDRRDIGAVVDYLLSTDGRGLTLQDDGSNGLLWLVRSEDA